MMEDLAKYAECEFKAKFKIVYDFLTDEHFPVSRPNAYVLGGQSGAGKTAIHDIIKSNDPNVISVDGDTFRKFHPNFDEIQRFYGSEAANYTQTFSNRIVNELIERLSDEKFNLIIEGTCRTADVPLKTCAGLKNKGYRTELDVMCVDKTVSWQGTIDRYNAMKARGLAPRAVPVDKYIEIVEALPKSVSKIYNQHSFDEICLYDRDRRCLYRLSEQPDTDPALIVAQKMNESPVSVDEMRKIAEKDLSALNAFDKT